MVLMTLIVCQVAKLQRASLTNPIKVSPAPGKPPFRASGSC
jgi:hypothetical protein